MSNISSPTPYEQRPLSEPPLTREMFEAEKSYQASLSAALTMSRQGIITDSEFTIISTKLREKYRPVFGTIFS
ncbi:MAG: hypothetical protein LUC92_00340 [Clostridiales bacterium]|nr:hypothetical protein [Clostridiales bacterium]